MSMKATYNLEQRRKGMILKRNILFILIIAFLYIFNLSVFSKEVNIIVNHSFEDGTDSPKSWKTWIWNTKKGISEFKYEKGNANTGEKFVTIINHEENDARYKQVVNVDENSMYKLSGYIKTKNVGSEKKGANISIDGKIETSKDFKGNNENWTYTEMYIKTGEGIKEVVITIGLGGYGNINTGMASFDDISMEKVESIPDTATISNIQKTEQNNNKVADGKNGSIDISNEKPVWILIPFGIVFILILYINFRKGKKGTIVKRNVDKEIEYEEYEEYEDDYYSTDDD